MSKPRVVFPFTEAGLGHIMPMISIADEFEKLYGDRVEVVRSAFFRESEDELLIKYENRISKDVTDFSEHPSKGFFATFNMDLWGTKISSWGAVVYIGNGASTSGVEHMRELKPDLVFSTHWATNYYAMKMPDRPLTAMYCPDAKINTLFRYPCDLTMISTTPGYERALKRHGKRFNEQNCKLVPFLIRKEAYAVESDKRAVRSKLGLDADKFTVIAVDGGLGLGRAKDTCEELLKRDLPINLIVVCGKNEEMFKQLSQKTSKGKTNFKVYGLTDKIMELIACSDLFCGKSGASIMAETCFFGVPQIITCYVTGIEKWIGNYYINSVGSAIKQFNIKKACDEVERFVAYPPLLQKYRQAALSVHGNYGAEKCARYIFGLLCRRFPELKDGTELV